MSCIKVATTSTIHNEELEENNRSDSGKHHTGTLPFGFVGFPACR